MDVGKTRFHAPPIHWGSFCSVLVSILLGSARYADHECNRSFRPNNGFVEYRRDCSDGRRQSPLKRALDEVTKGAAFKGSHRSAQFLEYVVHQSALGHLDALKERVIGVELFGRVPSYDTGEDAVVRVTASDVRKRLSAAL